MGLLRKITNYDKLDDPYISEDNIERDGLVYQIKTITKADKYFVLFRRQVLVRQVSKDEAPSQKCLVVVCPEF